MLKKFLGRLLKSSAPTKKQPASVAVPEDGEDYYSLEFLEIENGRGYVVVRDNDGQRLRWESLPKSYGLEAVSVSGVDYRQENLQDKSFDLGKMLTMVPEPDNQYDGDAVAIYDRDETMQIGYLPKDISKKYCKRRAKTYRCLSMWERRDDKGKRVYLRVLILSPKVNIKLPS